MQFNIENLFVFMDKSLQPEIGNINEFEWQKMSSASVSNKPLKKLKDLQKCIFDANPHILMLNEVGGLESLNNFNHYFLKDRYKVQMIEGNSDRGIDVGYLLRKDLEFKPLLLTHKERPLDFHYAHEEPGKRRYYFSRDVAELRLFEPDSHSPSLCILLTHLKSKLDPQGLDPLGRGRRSAELAALIDIYNEVRSELGQNTHIVVTGDFNGIASPNNTEEEFKYLYDSSDLLEVFECKNIPEEERFTQVQILPGRPLQKLQIDYAFISPSLQEHLESAFVYRFKDEWGEPLPHPTNIDQRVALPSDHYPVILEINL